VRILLIRHGESLGNVDPRVHATTADHAVPLSDRGHQQAREAGARLADYLDQHVQGERPHIRLWVSPYHRTRQTADRLVEIARGWITDRVEQRARPGQLPTLLAWAAWTKRSTSSASRKRWAASASAAART
jgi:broad specificity phosphatase PhoE